MFNTAAVLKRKQCSHALGHHAATWMMWWLATITPWYWHIKFWRAIFHHRCTRWQCICETLKFERWHGHPHTHSNSKHQASVNDTNKSATNIRQHSDLMCVPNRCVYPTRIPLFDLWIFNFWIVNFWTQLLIAQSAVLEIKMSDQDSASKTRHNSGPELCHQL